MKKSKRNKDFELKFYQGVVEQRPYYVDALIPLAAAYTDKGLYEEGLEIDLRLSKILTDDAIVHYNLACSYALCGNRKQALESLKQALKLGYADFAHMRRDKDLELLREDPEFQKLFPYRWSRQS